MGEIIIFNEVKDKKNVYLRIQIFFEKLKRALSGQSKGFFRVGKCKKCGDCCRDIALNINGEKVKKIEDFEILIKENPSYANFQLKMIGPEGVLSFECAKLGEDSLCMIYEKRPDVCIDYPEPDLLKCGGDVINSCGYYLVPPEDFKDVIKREKKWGN